jgi:hypothetical protein
MSCLRLTDDERRRFAGLGARLGRRILADVANVPAAGTYELVILGANAVERVVGPPQHSLENPRFSPDGR